MDALDRSVKGRLQENYALWLESLGLEFLDLIQDEIIRTKTMDKRLLDSFGKGDHDNVWRISNGGFTLEIGTNVDYASYINDGYKDAGNNTRFVRGNWNGDRFVYVPDSDVGMLLVQNWVEGTHYWDHALAIFEKMFERSLERRLQAWLDVMF